MASKVAAAALQYSKKLSKFICWTWALYRFAALIASAVSPVAAEALASTITGIDTIMIANVSTYLINSLGEKYLYSNKFLLSWLKADGIASLIRQHTKKNKEKEGEEDEYQNG